LATQTLPNTIAACNFRQFLKFGLVGVSNNVVDYVTWRVMMSQFHWGWLPAQLVAFMVSVTNGFIWNSVWTFRGMGSGTRHAQYVRFFVVNVISLGFGLVLMKTFLVLMNGQLSHAGPEELSHLNIAKAGAIVCCAVWNYTMNKKWTFR